MMRRYLSLLFLLFLILPAFGQSAVDTISLSGIDTLNTHMTDSLAKVSGVMPELIDTTALAVDSVQEEKPEQKVEKKKKGFDVPMDTVAIWKRYVKELQQLVFRRDSTPLGNENGVVVLDPYTYQLISQPALYKAPVKQMMQLYGAESSDRKTQQLMAINHVMARLYVSHPWLVEQTEDDIRQPGLIREDVADKLHAESNLAEKVVTSELLPEMSKEDKVVVKARRPNFWKFPGNCSFGFTQNYYTDNWGADNKYAGTATVVLNANYDDGKALIWTNNLDMRLGFQTNKSDKMRTFRPTTNRVVYNTNAGLRAVKSWYYSASVNIETKIVPEFQANSDRVLADLFSPMEVKIAPGMTYDFKYGKKKKFTGKLTVAPLAYNIMYVQRPSLVTRYGVKKGHHSRHSFGPTARVNFNYPITKQISWSSTLLCYSNLSRTQIDWSNTFNFSINKYMSASLFVHPVFDDNSPAWKGKWGYLRMEESLSLNMKYSF